MLFARSHQSARNLWLDFCMYTVVQVELTLVRWRWNNWRKRETASDDDDAIAYLMRVAETVGRNVASSINLMMRSGSPPERVTSYSSSLTSV